MKRQKLIDDIQKYIDKKRKKYFIINLIFIFYSAIIIMCVLNSEEINVLIAFLLVFGGIVFYFSMRFIIIHLLRITFNFKNISHLFTDNELEEIHNKITEINTIYGNLVSIILTERHIVLLGKKCNAILFSKIEDIEVRNTDGYNTQELVIITYNNNYNNYYIKLNKENKKILEIMKERIKENVKYDEETVPDRKEVIDKILEELKRKKEKMFVSEIFIFILITVLILTILLILNLLKNKYILVIFILGLFVNLFSYFYFSFVEYDSQKKNIYFYKYYDVSAILPYLSDNDVSVLYEKILDLHKIRLDGAIFCINDKLLRMGNKQYCILWDRIITLNWWRHRKSHTTYLKITFLNDDNTVNTITIDCDARGFPEEEIIDKCIKYKIKSNVENIKQIK